MLLVFHLLPQTSRPRATVHFAVDLTLLACDSKSDSIGCPWSCAYVWYGSVARSPAPMLASVSLWQVGKRGYGEFDGRFLLIADGKIDERLTRHSSSPAACVSARPLARLGSCQSEISPPSAPLLRLGTTHIFMSQALTIHQHMRASS